MLLSFGIGPLVDVTRYSLLPHHYSSNVVEGEFSEVDQGFIGDSSPGAKIVGKTRTQGEFVTKCYSYRVAEALCRHGAVTLPKKARSDKMVNGEGLEERVGELEKRRDDRFASLISLISVVVSVIALFISGATFFILEVPERLRAPAVELIMPPEARLAQIQNIKTNKMYSVRVYLQPAFIITGRSQRVEVLKPVNLFVQREGDQQCRKFWLDGIGRLTNNPEGRGLTFTYERGAAPLLVTQDTPQDAVLAFELRKDAEHPNVEDPYFVGEDHYLMTLVAETTTRAETLRSTIRVSANQDALKERAEKYLEGHLQSRKFVTSGARRTETPDDCPSSG